MKHIDVASLHYQNRVDDAIRSQCGDALMQVCSWFLWHSPLVGDNVRESMG